MFNLLGSVGYPQTLIHLCLLFLPPLSIKREILPLVKSLCQDVEYEVRSCMCRQLENIAQGIGYVHFLTSMLVASLFLNRKTYITCFMPMLLKN